MYEFWSPDDLVTELEALLITATEAAIAAAIPPMIRAMWTLFVN
jgi:hypothetical protein